TGGDAAVNYGPNSTENALVEPVNFAEPPLRLEGEAARYSRYNQDDFTQAGNLYRIFSEDEKARLVATISGSLSQASLAVQQRMVAHFTQADVDYGQRIKTALGL
ncbi:catalase-related domain-containing protein, partial [Shewanella sp.]|uniref:catalase-related domain-containing protein n=1 Tax=Shewanella sp. TaxID=50422 RepID=UPI003F39418B